MHVWTRRRFLSTSAAAASALWLPGRLAAQPPPATPVFTAVRGNVGTFTARGGTIGWLISPEGVAVVDSQFPDTAQQCLDGIRSRSRRAIDLLINTHHHGDHTGGNAVIRPHAAQSVAHARVPELMRRAAAEGADPGPGLPATTFESSWRLSLGDETVHARHFGPAHTGGDAVVTFERANVAHMGDLMFHYRHPFIDRPSGASIGNWIAVLEKTIATHDADTTYIFGHAKQDLPVTGGAADLRRMRDYLTAVLDHVRTGLKLKRSREEIAALPALRGFEDYQEAPPRLTLATVLGIAYDELTAA